MEEERTPKRLSLRSIEDAVAAAKLTLNPEEVRKTLDRLAEAKKVGRECLAFQFTV